jgi:hypothetical protein
MAIENPREIRGLLIAVKDSEVKRLNPLTYRVRSQSNPQKWYLVAKNGYNEWSCECPDHVHRRVVCKHIHAVKFSLKLRQRLQKKILIWRGLRSMMKFHAPLVEAWKWLRMERGKTRVGLFRGIHAKYAITDSLLT